MNCGFTYIRPDPQQSGEIEYLGYAGHGPLNSYDGKLGVWLEQRRHLVNTQVHRAAILLDKVDHWL